MTDEQLIALITAILMTRSPSCSTDEAITDAQIIIKRAREVTKVKMQPIAPGVLFGKFADL